MNEKIAVFGTGKIGSCEATLAAGNGFETVIIGHTQAGLDRCFSSINENYDDLLREGLIMEKNKSAAMKLITLSLDISALKDRTFIFEAVSEDISVKRIVYNKICSVSPDAVIASCTSSIDAEILADSTPHPENIIIAHPFQPAHMLPLVEVVKSSRTSESTVERTVCVLNALHREIVVLNKCLPGFLVNRFAHALFRESLYLIEEGVSTAREIDLAIKYAMGMRYSSIGLLEYYDDCGFELEKTIAENIYPTLCNSPDIRRRTLEGIASGKTGLAAGEGIYDWSIKDLAEYRYRKQAPYFDGVKKWDLPE